MSASVMCIRPDGAHIPPHLRPPALLAPGEYELRYVSHRVAIQYCRSVLSVWFALMDYDGDVVLPRYYNVSTKKEQGRTLIGGSPHCDLETEFRALFGKRGWRIDRIPITWFKNAILLGKVRPVTKKHNQRTRSDEQQYSVIGELISVRR